MRHVWVKTAAPAGRRSEVSFDALRRDHPLPRVVGAVVKLIRTGNELKGCCPFHEDRSPSLTIFAGGVRFHCFGCGASGDVLDFVQRFYALNLHEASEMIIGGGLPNAAHQPHPVPEGATVAKAAKIWRNSVPASETPAHFYLRCRGLHLPIPPSIRFARLRYGARSNLYPCLVALVVSAQNKPVGVQRTYLTEDGRKADLRTAKLSLGRIRGAAVRLAPADTRLIVTGGLEDGLTLQQELGFPVWAAAGEGNMAAMLLPDVVQSVVVGADRDLSGERFARAAAEAFADQGRQARIIRPADGFKDFDQELQEARP
jgi:DNA primase